MQHFSHLQANRKTKARSTTRTSYSNKASGCWRSTVVFLHDSGTVFLKAQVRAAHCSYLLRALRKRRRVKVSLATGGTLVTSYWSWTTRALEILSPCPQLCTVAGEIAAQLTPLPAALLCSVRWLLWMRSTKGWLSSYLFHPSSICAGT